jgi:signal peptidase I
MVSSHRVPRGRALRKLSAGSRGPVALASPPVSDPYAPPAAAPAQGTAEQKPRPASVALAALLTFLSLPAGHVYVGRPLRGVVWLVALTGYVVALEAFAPPLCRAIGLTAVALLFVGALAIAVAATVDAGKLARRRAQRMPVWLVLVVALAAVIVGRVLAFAERALLLESFKVPSGSMLPTIAIGDHLFVDKKTTTAGAPRRGEVIVFPFPEHRDQDFIKRVVGVGGDDIEIKGGRLWIDGWQVPRCRVGEWNYREDDPSMAYAHAGELSVEFLGDASYLVFEDRAAGAPFETMGPWHVKPGEVFVMGDNRNNAHDSRMWFGGVGGGVPVETVRGRAFIVWLGMRGSGVDGSRFGVDLSGRKPSPPAGAPELGADIARCMAERPAGTVAPPSHP